MKVIVAGSRDIKSRDVVIDAMEESGFIDEHSEIVCGTAAGVDIIGRDIAKELGLAWKDFPADWNTFPYDAGHRRNRDMAEYADALIAVWDGKSTGTKNMIETARELGLRVYIKIIPTYDLFSFGD